jgi:hypothetical protein
MPAHRLKLTIPALYCPDPVRVDDDLGDKVDELLLDWVREVGIFPDRTDVVVESQFGRFAVLAHPDTDDRNGSCWRHSASPPSSPWMTTTVMTSGPAPTPR